VLNWTRSFDCFWGVGFHLFSDVFVVAGFKDGFGRRGDSVVAVVFRDVGGELLFPGSAEPVVRFGGAQSHHSAAGEQRLENGTNQRRKPYKTSCIPVE
jgi:hypothetical protein